jgi:hypothetical protein
MIPRVHKRGRRVGGLLRYLYGPGKHEEHINPRIVAAWDGAGDLATLEPQITARGLRDYRHLVNLLEQPVRAGHNPPELTVWHCSLRNHDTDPIMSDEWWGQRAAELVAGLGLAPVGDTAAVRWLAVRHDDYGIHVVATLVRQDGRNAWAWNDHPRSRAIAAEMDIRFGLVRTGPADHTSHHHPHPAETHKANRLRRAHPTRDELRQRVRAAVVASTDEAEFFHRLADDGVTVKLRYSDLNPAEVTGYSVGLSADTDNAGQPIWFGGSKLAPDLSLPKLRTRWGTTEHGTTPTDAAPTMVLTAEQRAQVLAQAATGAATAAQTISRLAHMDPDACQALAQAAADTLTALARTVEGRRGGPLTRAALRMDKATRPAHAAVVPPTDDARRLRSSARTIALMGRIRRRDDSAAVLALILALVVVAQAIAAWRSSQGAWHQAGAADDVAARLRRWHTTPGAPASSTAATRQAAQPVPGQLSAHRSSSAANPHHSPR